HDLNQFCGMKWIKREFSVARTPQQNGVTERKNRIRIEAVRTILVDSLLPIPFCADVVNTACYVQNRVLVTKPHDKTPYELLLGRSPSTGCMRPFGCPVTILNTLDPLGKFDGKADDGGRYCHYCCTILWMNGSWLLCELQLVRSILVDTPLCVGVGVSLAFVSVAEPPSLEAADEPKSANTEGAAKKEGPEGAEPGIIHNEEPSPWSSIFYQPSKSSNLSFPSKVKKQKKDDEYEQLLLIFKHIHINLPFLEAMLHMTKGAKELPEHLEYAFLQENNQLLVVISSALSTVEKARLLEVLKNHKGAIAWSIVDIKWIDSSFYSHKTLMEDKFKPSVQPQRRVNPNIKEVVKKEVIKLFDARLIYPISDSPWSSVRVEDRQTFQAHTLRQQNNKRSARELHNYREGTFSCALRIRQVPSILGLIQDHFFTDHSALRPTHFCNYKMEKAMKRYGVVHRFSTAYHPQTNVQHKAYWAIKNCNLKLTKAGANRFLQIKELDEIRLGVYESSISYRERTKRWHDKWIEAPTNYEKGDKVLLFNSHLRLFPEKLKSRWYGPFSVCKDIKNGAIELYDEDGNKLIVNKQRVKPYQKSVLDTNKDDDITLDDEGEVT
nr:ribonuclease H-like domain-containing protein [Tanacetum cinerariifolium]